MRPRTGVVALTTDWYPEHTHTHFMAVFQDYPGEPVPEDIFWTFIVRGKITEADTPTSRLGAIPSSPHF